MSRVFGCLLVGLMLAAPTLQAADPVKQSRSGICHDAGSPYYARTKHYTPFLTLAECLSSGGRLPRGYRPVAAESVPSQRAAPATFSAPSVIASHAASNTPYRRDHFGKGWADMDGDCQSARHEALISQSTGKVRLSADGCRVTAGRWISPFTGAVIHDPGKIDIDHVVPLKWAWDHGAQSWTEAQRVSFANAPANLLSVESSLNRAKGAKGPNEWLPPANQCEYTLRFLRVVRQFRLSQSASEQAQMAAVRQRVCGV